MKNRAKCKLCHDIIVSNGDYIQCKCKEIAIDGKHVFWGMTPEQYENRMNITADQLPYEVLPNEEQS